MGNKLLIYAAADELYEHYVAPYIFFSLTSNPDAKCEILVARGYFCRNASVSNGLEKFFGSRFTIREINFQFRPDISRFTISPLTLADYCYMGDIDIMIIDLIMDQHLEKMREYKLPYSNIVRKNFIDKGIYKLTGLHFTEFHFHFPVDLSCLEGLDLHQYGSDENALYSIVKGKGVLPSLEYSFRPIHGLHLSQHGFPLSKTMGWGVSIEQYTKKYISITNTTNFLLIYPYFSEKFKVFHELAILSNRALSAYGELAFKLYPFMGGR